MSRLLSLCKPTLITVASPPTATTQIRGPRVNAKQRSGHPRAKEHNTILPCPTPDCANTLCTFTLPPCPDAIVQPNAATPGLCIPTVRREESPKFLYFGQGGSDVLASVLLEPIGGEPNFRKVRGHGHRNGTCRKEKSGMRNAQPVKAGKSSQMPGRRVDTGSRDSASRSCSVAYGHR